MHSVNLDEDNIERYMDYVTPDIGENIGRTFFRGLIIEGDDGPLAGMVWEVRNMMQNVDNESFISWLKVDDEEAGAQLFEEYKKSATEDEVVKTSFALPARSTEKERKALNNADFTVLFMEGDLIKARA